MSVFFCLNDVAVDNCIEVSLDGNLAKTKKDFNQQMKDIFNLPNYFNGLWDSLDECLNDLSWLSEEANFKLKISNFDVLLSCESKECVLNFMEILRDIDLNYCNKNSEIKQNFYVILQKSDKLFAVFNELNITLH